MQLSKFQRLINFSTKEKKIFETNAEPQPYVFTEEVFMEMIVISAIWLEMHNKSDGLVDGRMGVESVT